ncbi:ABC-2 type transport system ATP-binding protein [Microbacterium ginsengiterrae]|uniref:ABC-2 type transport system ATP-binding protein n=1 Tax=Microbacterium ginsengiterrae TaxID=546115 RepID=A0A7W9CCS9_9MICO|nr:ABC transporter ATP-binding protein [Microbacterium ginsengiterrae]MBB5743242.1 ABC-2 type transport system ATP-binding protein [Microbacterium ginsengiterrae]
MTDDMARIADLRVTRPNFEVSEVSFVIPRGQVVGLVGPNGAGKTTVIRSLLGLVHPDAGRIEVLGQPAGSSAALSKIGVVLDQPTAAGDWRVHSLGRRLGPFYPNWDEDRFLELVDQFGVPRDQRVDELSRGQGVKLSLAAALAQRPELLILDEPSSGLDPRSRRDIGDVIRQFMVDPQHAVLFSTHITTDLDDLADQLIVLVGGRVAHRGILPDAKDDFAMARGTGEVPDGTFGPQYSGAQWSALIRTEDSAAFGPDVVIDEATIDDIIIHLAAAHEEARV